MSDPVSFDLERFVMAQRTTYDAATSELRAGRKTSHWMWFVFPQMRGLGHSSMAQHYGIASLDEARAYLAHPVLGPRLVDCTRLVLAIESRSPQQIFGSPDDIKFRSSMTLFARASDTPSIFADAIDACCAGRQDGATLAVLGITPSDN